MEENKPEYKLITHAEVLEIARQDPEFIISEAKIAPFYDIAKQLFHERMLRKLTKREFAKLLKISVKKLENLENGDIEKIRISEVAEILSRVNMKMVIKLTDIFKQ